MSAKIQEEDCAIIGSGEPATTAKVIRCKGKFTAIIANPVDQKGVLVTGMGMFVRIEDHSRVFFAPTSKATTVTFSRLTKKSRVQYQQLLSRIQLPEEQNPLFRAIFYGEAYRVS